MKFSFMTPADARLQVSKKKENISLRTTRIKYTLKNLELGLVM
jgi:hypothetical protein